MKSSAGHDADMVYEILNRVESPANEFKRRQLPPTLIISRNAIGTAAAPLPPLSARASASRRQRVLSFSLSERVSKGALANSTAAKRCSPLALILPPPKGEGVNTLATTQC